MNHVPIKLGPLALLLAVVSICLAVLSILTFTTARADLALAEQYAETIRIRYVLEEQGQRFLAEAEPGAEQTFEQDGIRLVVALDEEGSVVRWTLEREWTQDEAFGNLWLGD